MRIEVDGGSYTSACDEFYYANHSVVDSVTSLAGSLGGSGSMAGSDSGGQDWAKQYDSVAGPLVQGGADMGAALAKMANLLNASLVNHEGADYGSQLQLPPAYVTAGSDGDSNPDHWTETVYPATPPSANGGTGQTPSGWSWVVDHLGGLLWPDADTGKLRAAGAAWVKAGQTLSFDTSYVDSAASVIGTQRSPEVPDAVAACNEMAGHLRDLGAAYTSIGGACNDYAQQVDDHHQMVEDELASFIKWTIVIEGAGALGSLVTFGGAEVAAQAAEAAEVANLATRVIRILQKLIELARLVATRIGSLLKKVTEIAGKLKKILGAKVEKALAKVGEKLGLGGLSKGEKDAYSAYRRRKLAAGKEPKSPEEWKRLKDKLKTNKANGDAFEKQMMGKDGIVEGEGGWSSQSTYQSRTGTRRWDYANESEQRAVEVKSGSTPVKEGLEQMSKDEEAVKNGWEVTWHLKSELSPTLMKRLGELQQKYPGQFHYDIVK